MCRIVHNLTSVPHQLARPKHPRDDQGIPPVPAHSNIRLCLGTAIHLATHWPIGVGVIGRDLPTADLIKADLDSTWKVSSRRYRSYWVASDDELGILLTS
jgi:hypothetical protein